MIVKLEISNIKTPEMDRTEQFTNFPLIIGRDEKAGLQLIDPRKMVSREHAVVKLSGEKIFIEDLGSRNFTFVNGERLEPGNPAELVNGSSVSIGEYVLSVEIEIPKAEIEIDDRTMIFQSPFDDDVAELAKLLNKINETYNTADSRTRNEVFRLSLMNSLSEVNLDSVGKIVTEFFSYQFPGENKQVDDSRYKETRIKEPDPVIPKKTVSSMSQTDFSISTQFSKSFDLMLSAFSKLIQGFWQFRQEFFGLTIYQTMPVSSAEKLKEHLFDPSIDEEESRKRLKQFEEETGKIIYHQMGLLEGYRDSVKNGTANMLKSLDPISLEREFLTQKVKIGPVQLPYKLLPFLMKSKIYNLIKEKFELIHRDPEHLEKKYYLPEFIKIYQQRLYSTKKE